MARKILHIITSLDSEGAQILLLNTVSLLNTEKYDIIICFIYGDGSALLDREVRGFKVVDLSNRGKLTPTALFKLIHLIHQEKIDIIHTHLVHGGVLGKLAAKLTRVKHIVTTRHYGYSDKQNSFLYRLEEKLTASCSAVIAISEAVKQYLISRKVVPEEKIVVIHNAVDPALFDPERFYLQTRLRENRFTIGSVGRLHRAKGFNILLKAFHIVSRQISNIELEIVGNGRLRTDLLRQSEELGINDRVKFVGQISQHQVAQRLSEWDLFVMPSLWEGFGIAIIEATAMGKAVVATRVGGIVEVVKDGKTGFLVPPYNPDALAYRIMELLRDNDKRAKMGREGRKLVISDFSLQQAVRRLENVYDSLM
ncbi:MAG: glycosyltransferase [Candidatus Marinimicrobia bacterium]|nr:glycosyltransferase [Candidatus Neomarinimicrobiota bacterium]